MKRDKEKISAGAEKVETLAAMSAVSQVPTGMGQNPAAPGLAPVAPLLAMNEGEIEEENAQAERRVMEAKAKKLQEQARERAQTEKQRIKAVRAEEKKAAARARKMEREEKAQHHRAERAKREIERRESGAKSGKDNGGKRDKRPGIGGWLAAVVALSVAVLALGAIVTVGYFDLNSAKSELTGGYRSSVYELSELVENMDSNLAKARIAGSDYEMQKLLTDVLVQSELAAKCLEDLPTDSHSSESMMSFVNRVGDYCKNLLLKLAAGETLSAQEEEVIEYMYSTTEKIRAAMPELLKSANVGTLEELLSSEGDFSAKFGALSKNTAEVPKSIADGPFSQSAMKKESKMLAQAEAITESQAASLAKKYFGAMTDDALKVSGKTQVKGMELYNFTFKDKRGTEYFAQITCRGGKLAYLDGYAPCEGENCNTHACISAAKKFLHRVGYDGMKAVWVGEANGECCINFVCQQDGVVIYPDMVKVKVCMDHCNVTGLEAHSYLVNHTDRTIPDASIPMSRIEANAQARMDLQGVRKALIEVEQEEVLTYEIIGEYGGRKYYAYVDANTGKTVEIFIVVETDRGSALL